MCIIFVYVNWIKLMAKIKAVSQFYGKCYLKMHISKNLWRKMMAQKVNLD